MVKRKKLEEMKKLTDKVYGECLAVYYKGEEVEIYLGEKSGVNYYSDYDVEQKVCVVGRIIDAVGELVLVDAKISDGVYREVAIHAWSITGVSKYNSQIRLSSVFQEMKR